MTTNLLLAAAACYLAGAAVDLVAGIRRRWVRPIPYLLALAGSAMLATAGIRGVEGRPVDIDLGSLLGMGRTTLRMDHLAGLFLTLLFGISTAISACFASWSLPAGRSPNRGLASAYLLLLGACAVVVLAGDAFTFLFAWESVTASFYALTTITRSERPEQSHSAWSTLGIGKVGGAALLLGFLLLAGRSGTLDIAAWHRVAPGPLLATAYGLIVLGFGAKLGLFPLHTWMPAGYPEAPGPARAAMAGVAANVGVYGLWRFLGVLGQPPVWLAVTVLLVGGLTALLGIAFAGVQQRLSRVIAYSSVENGGMIITAYGIALAGAAAHIPELVAVGLLAATLQVVTHALAKSTLFTAAANVEAAAGTDNLDELRGAGRALPWSGSAFAVGAITLAGLPPTIGFVSEWFILEALMQQFRLHGLALRLGLAGAGAMIALTSGLAALAFLRVLGITFLGRPSANLHHAKDTGAPGRAGLVLLAGSCLAIAAATPLEIRFLARGLSSLVPASLTDQALKSPWVLQPVFKGFSILSPSWMWLAMPALFVTVSIGAVVLSGGRYRRVRRVPAWHSATDGVAGPASYSAFGFGNPLRYVLANLLGTRREVQILDAGEQAAQEGAAHVEYTARVTDPAEAYLYRPAARGLMAIVGAAKRLQSGKLQAYVAYMLIALVAALAITAGLR